jgi:hypothetical protein
LTPQSSSRKRRTLPGPPEDRISGVRSHRSKKKLDFETTTEQPIGKKTNILNLPYIDSEPEKEDEIHAIKCPKHSLNLHRIVRLLLTLMKVKHQRAQSRRKHKKSRNLCWKY